MGGQSPLHFYLPLTTYWRHSIVEWEKSNGIGEKKNKLVTKTKRRVTEYIKSREQHYYKMWMRTACVMWYGMYLTVCIVVIFISEQLWPEINQSWFRNSLTSGVDSGGEKNTYPSVWKRQNPQYSFPCSYFWVELWSSRIRRDLKILGSTHFIRWRTVMADKVRDLSLCPVHTARARTQGRFPCGPLSSLIHIVRKPNLSFKAVCSFYRNIS